MAVNKPSNCSIYHVNQMVLFHILALLTLLFGYQCIAGYKVCSPSKSFRERNIFRRVGQPYYKYFIPHTSVLNLLNKSYFVKGI